MAAASSVAPHSMDATTLANCEALARSASKNIKKGDVDSAILCFKRALFFIDVQQDRKRAAVYADGIAECFKKSLHLFFDSKVKRSLLGLMTSISRLSAFPTTHNTLFRSNGIIIEKIVPFLRQDCLFPKAKQLPPLTEHFHINAVTQDVETSELMNASLVCLIHFAQVQGREELVHDYTFNHFNEIVKPLMASLSTQSSPKILYNATFLTSLFAYVAVEPRRRQFGSELLKHGMAPLLLSVYHCICCSPCVKSIARYAFSYLFFFAGEKKVDNHFFLSKELLSSYISTAKTIEAMGFKRTEVDIAIRKARGEVLEIQYKQSAAVQSFPSISHILYYLEPSTEESDKRKALELQQIEAKMKPKTQVTI